MTVISSCPKSITLQRAIYYSTTHFLSRTTVINTLDMENLKDQASSAAQTASSTLSSLTSDTSSTSNTNPMNQFYEENSSSSTAPASSKGGQAGAPQDETMSKQLHGQQEPVAGEQGKGTTEDPFDRGNEDERRDVEKRIGVS
jgi:hypothetical protein